MSVVRIGHSTIQHHFADITGSSLDPGTLAGHLFAQNLISKTAMEEAATPYPVNSARLTKIVMHVMSNGAEDGFRKFVSAIMKDESNLWLAEKLIETYRSKGGTWDTSVSNPTSNSSVCHSGATNSSTTCVPVPKPELRHLIRLKGFDWYNVGLMLMLIEGDLDTIAKDNRGYEEGAIRDMFKIWLKRQPDATYQQLVDAFRALGEERCAKELCQTHGIPMGTQPATYQVPQAMGTQPAATHQVPQAMGTQPATHQVPQAMGTQPATHQVPQAMGTQQATHQVPQAMGTQQATHQVPQAMGTQQATHQVPQAMGVPMVHQPLPNEGVAGTSPSTTTQPDSHSIFGERPITRQLSLIKYSDKKGALQRIRVLDTIAVHWLEVGRNLKISEDHLRIIKEGERDNPTKCVSAMVNKWLQSGQDPTWAKLIEALEDSELTTLVEDLKVALPRMKD